MGGCNYKIPCFKQTLRWTVYSIQHIERWTVFDIVSVPNNNVDNRSEVNLGGVPLEWRRWRFVKASELLQGA